jgi:chemotaxis protein methyltransferase WspC
VKRVENLLNREIGLAANSIGVKAIELAVRARMGMCRASTVDAYLGYLNEQQERRALVEEIVVSETWFFRDDEVFRALASFAVARQKAPAQATLRVLCMPCATGEEAYSAAIALLEAGLAASQFSVHGFDVSDRALEVARVGVYGKNSFRSTRRSECGPYFEAGRAGIAVGEAARSSVVFERGNVLDPLVAQAGKFDVVFCRNLLIYLDRDARGRALANIQAWLAKGGVLFGGHAEAIDTMDSRFVRVDGACHFAYRRRSELERVTAETPRAARVRVPLGPVVAGPPTAVSRTRARPAASETRVPDLKRAVAVAERPLPAASLEAVQKLADRAAPEAEAACQRHIAEHGPSSDAYCLLGLIRQAAGAEQAAVDCFNKALYLDQSHYGSLIHLVLIHERRQELTLAANFRRRAELAKSKSARP